MKTIKLREFEKKLKGDDDDDDESDVGFEGVWTIGRMMKETR